jgi:hypothetical protein
MPILVGADPDIGPCRGNRQALEPGETVGIGDPPAVGADVGEATPRPTPSNAGLEIADVAQAGLVGRRDRILRGAGDSGRRRAAAGRSATRPAVGLAQLPLFFGPLFGDEPREEPPLFELLPLALWPELPDALVFDEPLFEEPLLLDALVFAALVFAEPALLVEVLFVEAALVMLLPPLDERRVERFPPTGRASPTAPTASPTASPTFAAAFPTALGISISVPPVVRSPSERSLWRKP